MSLNKRFDSVTVICPMAIVIERDQTYHFFNKQSQPHRCGL